MPTGKAEKRAQPVTSPSGVSMVSHPPNLKGGAIFKPGNPGRSVMSEDGRAAAGATAGSRHAGPLTSIYMEMDRIQMRADFATSQWDETLLKTKDAEQEMASCRESMVGWVDSHEGVGQRQVQILTNIRNWMSNAAREGPEMEQEAAELDVDMDLSGVIGEINQSSQRAMNATSKAATDLRDLIHRMQPLVTTIKLGKKSRDNAKSAQFENALYQTKSLLSGLQSEKQAADMLLQANAARLSGLETRWADDRKKNEQKCKDYEHKIKILEMALANTDARARSLEQEARKFIKLRRKGSMAGMGGGEEGALVMLELQDKHAALRREHQDALHRIATLAQQLKEAMAEAEMAKQTVGMQEGSVERVKKLEMDLMDCRKRLTDVRSAAEEERARLTSEKSALQDQVRGLQDKAAQDAQATEELRRLLSSDDGEQEELLQQRVAKLEADAEAKDEDWKRRLADLRRGYETEAQKMRLKLEASSSEKEAELGELRQGYDETIATQKQAMEDMLQNFKRELDEQRQQFTQDLAKAHEQQQAARLKHDDEEDEEEDEEDAGVPGSEEGREVRRRRKLGLEEEVDRLRAQVNSVNAFTVQELHKKMETLTLQCQSVQSELAQEQRAVAALQGENGDLQREVERLRDKAAEVAEERADLRAELRDVREGAAKSEQELQDLRARVERMGQADGGLRALEEELSQARDREASAAQQMQLLENALGQVQAQLSVHEEAAESAAAHAQALEQAAQAAERRVQELQAHEKMGHDWAEEQPEARVMTPLNSPLANPESMEGPPPPLKVLLPTALAQGVGDGQSSESAEKEALQAVRGELEWHKTQLTDAIDRYDRLKVRHEELVELLRQQRPSTTAARSEFYRPTTSEGESEVADKLHSMLDDNDAEQAVHDFRRRSVHLAPQGQFKKEGDLDKLVDVVVADALGLAARGLAAVEGEERLLEELQDLPEADRAEALLLYRQKAVLLTNPEDANRLLLELVSEARSKSVLQRQQRQAKRTGMGREARAQAVRDGIDEDEDEPLTQEQGTVLEASGKLRKARVSLLAGHAFALPAQLLEEIEDYSRIEELGRTYPISLRDKRLKVARTGPRKEMAHAEAQADIKLARFNKNQQVDTVPWDLIRLPETPQFDWEEALMERARKQGKVLRQYTKHAVEKMWDMQSRLIRALDGDIEAHEVDHEMREMEKGLQRLIQEGRDNIGGLFKDDFGAKDPDSEAFFRKLQYGSQTSLRVSYQLEVGTQTSAITREIGSQSRVRMGHSGSQTSEAANVALLHELMKKYPEELPKPTMMAPNSPHRAGRNMAQWMFKAVETQTDDALEMDFARQVVLAEQEEERRKREAEEERRRLLAEEEDRNSHKIDYTVQLRADTLRSASWSCAIVSRLLQCLAAELKVDPRSERLLYIKKGLETKRAHLWEQMNRYGMREKLLLADKVRKFIFASKVARRLKAKTFTETGKTASSAKEAAASSNEVIVRVLADETQRQQLGPLDPLKLALAQIYVLKTSVEMQGGWRFALYGPNNVPDLDMNVREWPLREQLYIFEDIRQIQRERIEELEKSEHDLEIKLQLEQKISESSKFALGQARELEKALRDQVLFEQAKLEKLQHPDPLRGLDPSRTSRPTTAGDDFGTTQGRPTSLRGTSRNNTPPRMAATRMLRGQKDLLGATMAPGPRTDVVIDLTKTMGATGEQPSHGDEASGRTSRPLKDSGKAPSSKSVRMLEDIIQEQEGDADSDSSTQADEPKQPATASPKSSGGGGAASPEAEHSRKKPRTQPASPPNGDMVSVASKVSQAEKSQTSHTSSSSSSRESMVQNKATGDLLTKSPSRPAASEGGDKSRRDDLSVASSVGDGGENDAFGGWPIDELMREREAVADLHQVLIEALRAMLGLCGIGGTVDGVWPQSEVLSPRDTASHPNRHYTDVGLDGVRHSVDKHREYSLDQRGGNRFHSPPRGRSPVRQRSHSPFRSNSASSLRPNTRGNQSAESSRAGSPTSPHRNTARGMNGHPLSLSFLLRGLFNGRAGALTLPGQSFTIVPATDKVKVLVKRLKNRKAPLTADEVVPVMIADAKRLLTTVLLVKKRLDEQEKSIADSIRSRDAEIRMLVEEHLYLKKELARLKADYVSEEVADTIRNLRHHIIITDRQLDKTTKRVRLLQDAVETKGSLAVLEEMIAKGTELSMQMKQLTVRHDELAARLAEAKEQLLLLGDVDRDDENKVFMRKTMEGVVEWAEKEVTHAQYRLQLLQRERDDNINFSIEIYERIERFAHPIFNSSSFRGFLEWARHREHKVRHGKANKGGASGAEADTGPGGGSLGDEWHGADGSAEANAFAFLSAQAPQLDSEGIISEIRGLLAVRPEHVEIGYDNRSLTSAGSGQTLDRNSHTSSTQVRPYVDLMTLQSAVSNKTRRHTSHGTTRRLDHDDRSMASEVSLPSLSGWSSISSVSIAAMAQAEVPEAIRAQPHQNRGLPLIEKIPPMAKRYNTEHPLGLRKKSFVRKR